MTAASVVRMEDEYRFAKLGYEGYAAFTGGKTFDGRDMPKWDDLPSRIKDAWNAGVKNSIQAAVPVALHMLATELEETAGIFIDTIPPK